MEPVDLETSKFSQWMDLLRKNFKLHDLILTRLLNNYKCGHKINNKMRGHKLKTH